MKKCKETLLRGKGKMHMNRSWIGYILLCTATQQAIAEEDLFALPLEELSRLEVSIATGTPKPITSCIPIGLAT